jgi:hypothetical protein
MTIFTEREPHRGERLERPVHLEFLALRATGMQGAQVSAENRDRPDPGPDVCSVP